MEKRRGGGGVFVVCEGLMDLGRRGKKKGTKREEAHLPGEDVGEAKKKMVRPQQKRV
jgi:hypothetical protein